MGSKTICKDCEQDYGYLNNKGICIYCSRRKSNLKYLGKEYIPLAEIKGTVEYRRAISKRESAIAKSKEKEKEVKSLKKKVQTKAEIIAEQKEIDIETRRIKSFGVEDKVKEDIEKYYNDKGIIVRDDYQPLEIVFEWLFNLCQKDNYMIDLDRRRQVYEMLIVDYLHELKNVGVADREYFADIGEKIAIVQNLRTPIDNEVDKYVVIEPFIKKIQENQELMTMLQDLRIKLLNKIKNQEDPKYISKTPSLQNYDFVITPVDSAPELVRKISKPELKNRYAVEIAKVKGLYGNPQPQPFNYNGYILADTPEEAKQNFINFMKREFPTLSYVTSDIKISLWSESEKRSL